LTPNTVSDEDVAGPFTKAIPSKLAAMATLRGLSYTGPLSEIAEKFHMSPNLLRELNPRADFGRSGTAILVADVPEMKLRFGRFTIEVVPPIQNAGPTAATIVVDKPARNVRAYDHDGRLLAFYPATIGSEEKPAPSGVFKVRRVDWNPQYHYDPKFAWKGVKTNRKLTVQPGPNNPVGLVWDRPYRPLLGDSRHPCARGHQQDPIPWLHPSDELGRGRLGDDGAVRNNREVRGSGYPRRAVVRSGRRTRAIWAEAPSALNCCRLLFEGMQVAATFTFIETARHSGTARFNFHCLRSGFS
jgi:lipoprotein-anchoring transpeptidase ErfK/SrfK